MLLNDGTGTSFTEIPIPQTTVGAGDDAYALDYDHNGLMDFPGAQWRKSRSGGAGRVDRLLPVGSSDARCRPGRTEAMEAQAAGGLTRQLPCSLSTTGDTRYRTPRMPRPRRDSFVAPAARSHRSASGYGRSGR